MNLFGEHNFSVQDAASPGNAPIARPEWNMEGFRQMLAAHYGKTLGRPKLLHKLDDPENDPVIDEHGCPVLQFVTLPGDSPDRILSSGLNVIAQTNDIRLVKIEGKVAV